MDFGELGYLLPCDVPLPQFIDLWLHITKEDGTSARLLNAYLGS